MPNTTPCPHKNIESNMCPTHCTDCGMNLDNVNYMHVPKDSELHVDHGTNKPSHFACERDTCEICKKTLKKFEEGVESGEIKIPTQEDWEKEFDRIYMSSAAYSFSKPTRQLKDFVVSLLLQMVEHCDTPDCPECDMKAYNKGYEEARNTPMGASNWKEHGEKYKYWDFFMKQERERIVRGIYKKMLLDDCIVDTIKNKEVKESYLLGLKHQRMWVERFAAQNNITLSESEEGKSK